MKYRIVLWVTFFALQFAVLFAMVADRVGMLVSPATRSVWLESAPVDPYSIMKGHYFIIDPQIGHGHGLDFAKSVGRDVFVKLSDFDCNRVAHATEYVVADKDKGAPTFPEETVFIKGTFAKNKTRPVKFGIEEFYCSEEDSAKLNALLCEQMAFQNAVREVQKWLKNDAASTSEVLELVRNLDLESTAVLGRNVNLGNAMLQGPVLTENEPNSWVVSSRRRAVATLRTASDDIQTTMLIHVRLNREGIGILDAVKFGSQIFRSKLSQEFRGQSDFDPLAPENLPR